MASGSWWSWMRREVLYRDGYRCTRCDSGRNLQVHHLEYGEFEGHDRTVVSPEKLTTLCKICHMETHKINRYDTKTAAAIVADRLRFDR
jgi:5-methylcytosine-specific restriction endonuclease McrA